jgi:hypothetical protein
MNKNLVRTYIGLTVGLSLLVTSTVMYFANWSASLKPLDPLPHSEKFSCIENDEFKDIKIKNEAFSIQEIWAILPKL